MKRVKKGRALLLHDVPPEVVKNFKVFCLLNERSMKDTLVEFMSGCAGTIAGSYKADGSKA